MANIVIAIISLVITFMLASYGVYTNVEASRRTQFAMAVGSTLERNAGYIQDLAQDLGRVPSSADIDTDRFLKDSGQKISYDYLVVDGSAYVCARTNLTDSMTRDAMNMAARDRPGAFVSGFCGFPNQAIVGRVVLSLKVG